MRRLRQSVESTPQGGGIAVIVAALAVAAIAAAIGFIALLLGCIGVASAIHIYIREKINSIALLRCLGTTSRQAFMIYLIQNYPDFSAAAAAVAGNTSLAKLQSVQPRFVRRTYDALGL